MSYVLVVVLWIISFWYLIRRLYIQSWVQDWQFNKPYLQDVSMFNYMLQSWTKMIRCIILFRTHTQKSSFPPLGMAANYYIPFVTSTKGIKCFSVGCMSPNCVSEKNEKKVSDRREKRGSNKESEGRRRRTVNRWQIMPHAKLSWIKHLPSLPLLRSIFPPFACSTLSISHTHD